jgi:hypothetical protein
VPDVNFSRGKKISISGNPSASAKHVLSEVERRRQVRIDLEENHGLRRQLPGLPVYKRTDFEKVDGSR